MRTLATALALGLLLASCARPREVVVFHAVSLAPVLSALEFSRRHPGWRLRLEPSGSLIAARKVSELGLRADLVLTADAQVLTRLLQPAHVGGVLTFASNELVLAHREHSRYTAEVTADSWPAILLRNDVRLARVNPDTGPLGYNTLCLWQLEALRGQGAPADLEPQLRARIPAERVVPDEDQLVSLLEARSIDYAFVYRSTALTHHLKLVRLPAEINLAALRQAATYARAHTQARVDSSVRQQPCAPVRYGLAIPRNALQPEAAQWVVSELLSADGARLLERFGLTPIQPALWRGESPPDALRSLLSVEAASSSSSPAASGPAGVAP